MPIYTPVDFSGHREKSDISLIQNKSIKALVVDDIEFNRFYLKSVLDTWNIESKMAENGQCAIEMLQQEIFDIVLTDINMPVMDGVEVSIWIRKTMGDSLPIIAVTTYDSAEQNNQCDNAGINSILHKPFTPEELWMHIKFYLSMEQVYKKPKQTDTSQSSDSLLYNTEKLKRMLNNDTAQFQKAINMLLDTMPESLANIQKAYNDKDKKQLGFWSHKIKTVIDTLDIESQKQAIRKLHQLCTNNAPLEEMTTLVLDLLDTLDKVLVDLKEESKVTETC